MSVGYSLVNFSKKEQLLFSHLPVSTRNEIESNPVTAFLVSWYRDLYPDDEIEFVSDTYDDWPFKAGFKSDLSHYQDITDQKVKELIKLGHLIDLGIEWEDEDEPDKVFIRRLELNETEQTVALDQDKLGQ